VPAREGFDDDVGLSEMTPSEEPPAPLSSAESTVGPRATSTSEDDDSGVREPAVPRGTFASELPERGSESDEREPNRAEVIITKAAKPPPGTASGNGSQRVKTVRAVQRPPYLASEILREDLTPSEPGRRELGLVLQLAPALGALAALGSGIQRSATWVAVAMFAALFALTRLELRYTVQSVVVALTGTAALALVAGWRMVLGGGWDDPLLASSVTLLSSSLLFRAWYRAAPAARFLVLLALTLALSWATMSSHRELLSLEFSWHSWLPALTWYLFGLLCLLSLLAFMGGDTTGGCDVWALSLFSWYALFAGVRYALETTAIPGLPSGNVQTLGLIEPALAAPTAVAYAQIFARTLGTRGRRHALAG
jgi:hypothetical protein